jgi:phospholipase C
MRIGAFLAAMAACSGSCAAAPAEHHDLSKIKHIIVIYEENRSFDTLYGGFPGANGLANAGSAAMQVKVDGTPFTNLPAVCWKSDGSFPDTDATTGAQKCSQPDPDFLPLEPLANGPFDAEKAVPLDQMSHEDLVHRFYQEQVQIDDGRMDKFAAVSDAGGLTMGHFDGSKLEMWKYAQDYVLADNFFHAAFGGSFLNHQWLACACTPVYPYARATLKAQFGTDGTLITDGIVTPDGFAVNTIYPASPPHPEEDAKHPRLPLQDAPTIGDRMSDRRPTPVSWAWYSGGFNDALAGKVTEHNFQYHHQPYVYFRRYAEGEPGRLHLKDGADFEKAIADGKLPEVSFYKPVGDLNQHPSYATLLSGDQKTAELIRKIQSNKKLWSGSVIIVTYDENGGTWDHVAPPKIDNWGPGTRIPAIIISPFAKRHFVDHTQYDTTSILKFIEVRYGLAPLTSRDATANDLTNALQL